MRVIVTRPEREAGHWVQQLASRGLEALALPLIRIEPAPDPQPVRQAWHDLAAFDALMFVSGNAVDHFFRQKPQANAMVWASPAIRTRAWATGPSTRQALATAGVDPGLIDAPEHLPADAPANRPADAAQYDSEALWLRVAGQVAPGHRVLIVRGADDTGAAAGRGWLAAQLENAGAQVHTVAAYQRRMPTWDAGQLAQARLAAQPDSDAVWLFSSSEAIGNLVRLLPGHGWSGARALTTHPRIAQAAREAGFGVVYRSLPALEAIVAALESVR